MGKCSAICPGHAGSVKDATMSRPKFVFNSRMIFILLLLPMYLSAAQANQDSKTGTVASEITTTPRTEVKTELPEYELDDGGVPQGSKGGPKNGTLRESPTSVTSDVNTTLTTPSHCDNWKNDSEVHFCMPSRYRGHWWPKTAAGEKAYKKCLFINDGEIVRHCVKRKLNILDHKANSPHWLKPDYSGCVSARRTGREERKRIDPCPYDTSYATEWPETPANYTATAPCPRTMRVNRTDVMATRRYAYQLFLKSKRIDPCPYDTSYATEWPETPANYTATAPCPRTMRVNRTDVMATRRYAYQLFLNGKRIEPCPYDTSYATEWPETPANYTATAPCPRTMRVNRTDVMATRSCVIQREGTDQVGVWSEPYLVDCVVATMDTKIPPKEETVALLLNVWMSDNSCEGELTNSSTGSFQWNTTIVGGTDIGMCPFGSLVPPPEAVEFIKFSIGIAAMFIDLWKNFTLPINDTGGDWNPVRRNDSDLGLTNETLQTIKEELIDRVIKLIENVTLEFRDIDGDRYSNRDGDDDGQSDKFNRRDDQSHDKSNQNDDVTFHSDPGDSGINQQISVANWWVNIGKAVDRMDQRKFGNNQVGVTKILDIMQAMENLPRSFMNRPMLPAITIDTGRILLDLRGIDPVVKAMDDLRMMENRATSGSRSRRDVRDDVIPDTSRNDVILDLPSENEDMDDEEEFLFNLTAAIEAWESAAKFPTRQCDENGLRAGVIWKHADTWMCRTENASYLQDVVRLLDDTGYLDEIKRALEKSGISEQVDGTLLRIVFRMWDAFNIWRQTRQKSKLTINAIQAISYLLSLDVAVLPPWLSQQIVQMIEDMANEPLPDDVTSVDIVTENVVVNIAEVQMAAFVGITFASMGHSSGPLTGDICDISECSLGDNMFLRVEGDLNDTLTSLDSEALDEYFFLPQTIFNLSAHIMSNQTYCKHKDSINDTIDAAGSLDLTPLLQFVIYENDQLFRTKAGEVPVVLPDSCQLNGTRQWRVATRVISGTVGGYCMSGLPQPIVYSMRHMVDVSESEHRLCVFWDYNERGGLGAWSTHGCQVYESDETQTTCECDHLTNFAVIVDIWEQLGKGRIPVTHDTTLGIISLVGCSLSLIGLVVTILCLIFVKHLRESKTTPTRLMLCLTLFISMMFLLVGMERTEDPDACAVFAFFIHYFTLTSLMWMGIEAVYLYRNIVAVVINPNKNFFHYCCGIAWGVPAVICALTAAMNWDAYGDEHRCWISGVGVFFGAFLAPVLVIVTLNFVVFGMVLCVLSNRPKDRISSCRGSGGASVHKEPVRKWKEFMGIVSITVLLGLTWIFGAFSVGNEARLIFLYLFTIFNSTQGFFIFIFYCLLSLIGGKKSRSCQRISSTDKMAGTGIPSGMSISCSSRKVPLVRVDADEEGELRKQKLMADWMASCKDLHLEVGQDMPDELKGNFNKAFCFMDEEGLHEISSAGDLAYDSGHNNSTMLGIVMSARLIRMHSRSSDEIKTKAEEAGPKMDASGEEDGLDVAPEFVVSTGIIFGGKVRRSSVASME